LSSRRFLEVLAPGYGPTRTDLSPTGFTPITPPIALEPPQRLQGRLVDGELSLPSGRPSMIHKSSIRRWTGKTSGPPR
jgi:hypothetical protein